MSLTLERSGRSDEELMSLAQADDAEAFGQLYDRHAARAFKVASAVCRTAGDAEDAVQAGFLEIWDARAGFRQEAGAFKAWAMRIVQKRAIETSRSTTSRPHEGKALPSREGEARLAALRRLPEPQSEIIVLALYGELSHSEIAAQLGLPSGTVKGRMRLGLEELRTEISVIE